MTLSTSVGSKSLGFSVQPDILAVQLFGTLKVIQPLSRAFAFKKQNEQKHFWC